MCGKHCSHNAFVGYKIVRLDQKATINDLYKATVQVISPEQKEMLDKEIDRMAESKSFAGLRSFVEQVFKIVYLPK